MFRCKTILSSILCCVFLASCAYQYEPLVKDKRIMYYNDVRSALVVPFIDHTKTPGLNTTVTDTFTAELARFDEVAVVHSSTITQYLAKHGIRITEVNVRDVALRLGQVFKTDAVIIGAVTEHNPYFPPILGLSFELIAVNGGTTIYAESETYDASFNNIRAEVDAFAGLRDSSDSVFGREVVLHKMALYIEFVCYSMIKKNL